MDEKYTDLDEHNKIAGFNTQGYVKTKCYKITPAESLMPWQGLYYRTDFHYFEFFPFKDSPGGDYPIPIIHPVETTLPMLVRSTENLQNPLAAGFNSNWWIKQTIKVPPPNDSYNTPQEGIWVRVEWPDFWFLPGLDSNGNDIKQLKDATTVDLITAALNEGPDTVLAFNTQGYLKSKVNSSPNEQSDEIWGAAASISGVYVRQWPAGHHAPLVVDGSETNPDDNPHDQAKLETTLFVLKGTHQIWAKSFIADGNVRADYQKAVETAANELMQQAKATGDYWGNGIKAVNMRNELLVDMRRRTSPLGLMVAKAYKPQGGTAAQYLDKVAKNMKGKPYSQLNPAEAAEVGRSLRTIIPPRLSALWRF